MEIKRQVEIKNLKYPENSFTNSLKYKNITKRTTLFSALLFSMLSNNPAYGVGAFDSDVAILAGGVQVHPLYHVSSTINMIAAGFQIIAIISLITTIFFTAQMCKLKKKNNFNSDSLEENVTDVEIDDKTNILKRIKKKLVISRIVLVSSIIIFIVLMGINRIIY